MLGDGSCFLASGRPAGREMSTCRKCSWVMVGIGIHSEAEGLEYGVKGGQDGWDASVENIDS